MTATALLPMTTSTLLDRLRRHYIKPSEPMPGGVFVPECGWNDGGRNRSRCDALYIGFTTTSGRQLIGHELKVSRSDWRHELDKPGKADPWHDQCHAWYVVAPSTEIVPPEELPDGWGLMVINPKSKIRLDTVVKARYYPDRQPSWAATRSIFARLDTLRGQTLQDEIHRARQAARDLVEKQYRESRAGGELPHDVRDRLYSLDQLEGMLGVTVASITLDTDAIRPEIAARLIGLAKAEAAMVRDGNLSSRYELDRVEQSAGKLLESIAAWRDAVTELKQAGQVTAG